jgi:hypothetical protein
MSHALHIVVTCTDRKKKLVPDALLLRDIEDAPIAERASAWIARLSRRAIHTVPAGELYAGDHWAVTRELPGVAKRAGFRPKLWVCSAGYGLVPAAAELKPYGATFTRGHADSVYRPCDELSPTNAAEQWWEHLARWRGPQGDHPRKVHELVDGAPSSYTVVVASAVYLAALVSDLSTVRVESDRLLVISSGSTGGNGLGQYLLPADARLQRHVGGARQALNIRLARWALERICKKFEGFDRLRQYFRARLGKEEHLMALDRTPMSDVDIKGFIESRLRQNPKARHTPLLRELRDSGQACEQKRFRNLYLEVRGRLNVQAS